MSAPKCLPEPVGARRDDGGLDDGAVECRGLVGHDSRAGISWAPVVELQPGGHALGGCLRAARRREDRRGAVHSKNLAGRCCGRGCGCG